MLLDGCLYQRPQMRVSVACSSQVVTFKLAEDALLCLHRQMLLRLEHLTTYALHAVGGILRSCELCCCCWQVHKLECRLERSLLLHTLPLAVVIVIQLADDI